MGQRGIPRDVQSFIRDHLSSVAQLEILLLLHADRGRPYGSDEVARNLRIEPTWAASELEGLRNRGLLSQADGGRFCYAPEPELEPVVDALSRAFATHRVSVITMIFSTPSDSIGSFADAFKLRSDDDG